MVKQLLLTCLLAASCFGQAFTLQDQPFLASSQGTPYLPYNCDFTTGLLTYWPLSEGTNTWVYDSYTNGQTGSFSIWFGGSVAPNWVTNTGLSIPGRNSAAVQCSTPQSYVNCGNADFFNIITNDFSLSIWVYHTGPSYNSYEMAITGLYDRNTDLTHFNLGTRFSGGFNRYHCYVSNVGDFDAGPVLPNSTWTFLVLTRTFTTFTMWTNAVMCAQDIRSGYGSQSEPCRVMLGCDPHSSPRNWQGYIAEARIYKNYALSSNEVWCLYHQYYGQP